MKVAQVLKDDDDDLVKAVTGSLSDLEVEDEAAVTITGTGPTGGSSVRRVLVAARGGLIDIVVGPEDVRGDVHRWPEVERLTVSFVAGESVIVIVEAVRPEFHVRSRSARDKAPAEFAAACLRLMAGSEAG